MLTSVVKPMKACPQTPPDVTRVVRMLLKYPFDADHPNRDIKFKDSQPNDEDDDANGDGQDNKATTGGALDINLVEMDKGDGKYAEIRVILKDTTNWKFHAGGSDGIEGVGMTHPNDPMGICGAHVVTAGRRWPVAIFYIPIKVFNGDLYSYATFDLSLTRLTPYPRHAYRGRRHRNIFVDPKVMNNG